LKDMLMSQQKALLLKAQDHVRRQPANECMYTTPNWEMQLATDTGKFVDSNDMSRRTSAFQARVMYARRAIDGAGACKRPSTSSWPHGCCAVEGKAHRSMQLRDLAARCA
jgi:hypothetical protein